MTRTLKLLGLAIALPLVMLGDLSPEAPFGLSFLREAHAVVGAPMTPVSVAGVARRTTRRTVAATGAAADSQEQATAEQQSATAQQQSATAQQQSATAQQQAATAQQQGATAQPQAKAAPPPAAPAGANPAVGSVVTTLPAGCVATSKDGIEYQRCGNVTYRAAFQSNNLVYVVQ